MRSITATSASEARLIGNTTNAGSTPESIAHKDTPRPVAMLAGTRATANTAFARKISPEKFIYTQMRNGRPVDLPLDRVDDTLGLVGDFPQYAISARRA